MAGSSPQGEEARALTFEPSYLRWFENHGMWSHSLQDLMQRWAARIREPERSLSAAILSALSKAEAEERRG